MDTEVVLNIKHNLQLLTKLIEKVTVQMPGLFGYFMPVTDNPMKNRSALHKRAVERRKKAKRGGRR